MVVLLDNGHGCDTHGKQSPDGRLREYLWARQMTAMIAETLISLGFETYNVCPEVVDIPLSIRAKRCNDVCKARGVDNCILISIHVDAHGSSGSEWSPARGLTSFVYEHAGQKARNLAKLITNTAKVNNLLGNRSVPSSGYKEANFAILRETACPAVLVECGFMTNKDEVEFLLSPEGKAAICKTIVSAVDIYKKVIL